MVENNFLLIPRAFCFTEIIRRGYSFGDCPGVVFSNGQTWTEVRRNSLHILRDLGMGKNTLEDMIEDEVDNLIQNIEDNWIDVSVDPTLFFNIAVLASIWRVISGESLKVGDPKLEKLMINVQNLLKEFSNPLSFIAFQSIPIAKIVHKLGILDFFNHTKNILDFCDSSLKSHSIKQIDGDNPLTFMEAFLHKIRTTNECNMASNNNVETKQ